MLVGGAGLLLIPSLMIIFIKIATTMSERECQEEEEDQDECEQRYPGLDKRHGFFRVINKNQVSRDEYHWNQQERQQRRKETLQSEVDR